MSAFDRFERDFADALQDLAPPRVPDYFDDVLERAVSQRQRPAWTFPERWLPMSVLARRPAFAPALPWRTIGLLIILALLLAAMFVIGAGTLLERTAPPYGLAANGVMAYSVGGDIYTRDLDTGDVKLLVGGPEPDFAPWYSRDGTKVSFIRGVSLEPEVVAVMVVNADGSNLRTVVAPEPAGGYHWHEWSPDSKSIAVQNEDPTSPILSVINVDGEPVRREIELPVTLQGFDWRPGSDELILRGLGEKSFAHAAIYAVGADGTGFRRLTEIASRDSYREPYAHSHDGRLLAYTSWEPREVPGPSIFRVHVLDLDTGADRALAGTDHQAWPVFSPDGESLAFIRYSDEQAREITAQVVISPVEGDGSNATPTGPAVRIPSGTRGLAMQFSPDGTQMVITQPDALAAWLVDLSTGSFEPTDWEMDEFDPAWQRRAP